MNITQLYTDYNIQTAPPEHRHSRAGWVNTACPYCSGNPGYHLGFSLSGNYYYCWRCGYHYLYQTLSQLLHTTEDEARTIVQQYGGVAYTQREPPVHIRRKAHRLPTDTYPMTDQHKKYLKKRGFDPERLEREWMLLGTGPAAQLDGIDFKHRVLAPVIWQGEQVSFQCRDITGKSRLKYLTCPRDRELKHHKHILYGNYNGQTTGIIVEGITDVWRLGTAAFATFGIEYTQQQMRLISKLFKRTFIIFDPDPQALKQAEKLTSELKFRNIDAYNISVDHDPGSMTPSEAEYFIKQRIW
jgi:hypothetical protein